MSICFIWFSAANTSFYIIQHKSLKDVCETGHSLDRAVTVWHKMEMGNIEEL